MVTEKGTQLSALGSTPQCSMLKCMQLTRSRWDLNASCSGCLPEFFLGFFKFQCMLLEKKSYLVEFSFKFNAIKFGNLLMNWFIWEKCSPIVIINLGL